MTSGVNPGCIQAETVFGAVRRQGNPDGLVTAGVFGKPKLGRLFAGGSGGREHDADYLWAPCADDKGKDDDDYCAKVPLDEDNGYAKDDATPMNAVLDTMRRGVGKAEAPARLHLREPAAGGRHRATRRAPARASTTGPSARPTCRSSGWWTSSRRAASGAGPR